jgi:hypothetical protein
MRYTTILICGLLLASVVPARAQFTGPSSSASPYILPTLPGVTTTSLLTVGDSVPKVGGGTFRLVGIPDGLGAYDNGNGTLTILVNHELAGTAGVVRDHGSAGAFVSRFIMDKATRQIVSGQDLVQTVRTWNTATSSYNAAGTTVFTRLCSADLARPTAYFNAATGLGTTDRIFLSGEESGAEGRVFAKISGGANDRQSWQLPRLGRFSWENALACPQAQDRTVVIGLDDSAGGQLYIYSGTKTSTGTTIDRAGLTNGTLYGLKVTGMASEPTTLPAASQAFTLFDHGNVSNTTGAALQTASAANAVTAFQRPEDGAWNPAAPQDFYFVTTTTNRLWRLRFADISNPTLGGSLQLLLTGGEGQVGFDNVAVSDDGKTVLINEDPGSSTRLARTWAYDIASGAFNELARSSDAYFATGGASFLTTDEEHSGVLDITGLMGLNDNTQYLLTDVQAHYSITGELVQGGQLLMMTVPVSEPLLPATVLMLLVWGRCRLRF